MATVAKLSLCIIINMTWFSQVATFFTAIYHLNLMVSNLVCRIAATIANKYNKERYHLSMQLPLMLQYGTEL